jgi:hypothetical protein
VKDDDELMIVTDRGQTLRTKVAEVRETGRNAQGVKIMTVDEGERLVGFERLAEAETDGSAPPGEIEGEGVAVEGAVEGETAPVEGEAAPAEGEATTTPTGEPDGELRRAGDSQEGGKAGRDEGDCEQSPRPPTHVSSNAIGMIHGTRRRPLSHRRPYRPLARAA